MALAVGVLFLNTALPICPQVRASVNRDLGGGGVGGGRNLENMVQSCNLLHNAADI